MTLFWLVSAWIVGIGTSATVLMTPGQWGILAMVAGTTLLLQRRTPNHRILFALLLALTLGGGRAALTSAQGPPSVADFNDLGSPLTVRGQVVRDPDRRDSYTGLTISVREIRAAEGHWIQTAGLALARADPFTDWRYGDEVVVDGRLETPPIFEGFSYREYLARQGIHSLIDVETGRRVTTGHGNPIVRFLYTLRRRAHTVINRLFPEPEASLLSGILLGIESGIPADVRAAFNATGTTHIIAISGFNITIVAGVFVDLLGRGLGARRGSLAAAVAIALYTLLVGADAAVVRAALMGGLALAAKMLGRRPYGFASLAAAALIMTLLDPRVIADVGFQLSFAATLGLLIYGERFQEGFKRMSQRRLGLSPSASDRVGGLVSEYFLLTLAAQATTLPLMLFHFGRLSLVSPLANLVILPLQPLVMILGGIATIAGLVTPPLALPLAWIAWPFPALTIRAVEAFARLPGASANLPRIPLVVIVVMYLGLTLLTLQGEESSMAQTGNPPRNVRWSLLLLCLGVAAVLAWRIVTDQPDGRLHLTVLNLEQGSGVLLETPTGRHVLINGGASGIALGQALDRRMSPFSRTIDWLVLTDSSTEQIGGVAQLIERYQIGGALVAGVPRGSAYRALAQGLERTNRPVGRVEAGTSLALGDGAILEFVAIGEGHLALRLEHGRARVLLVPSADPGWIASLQGGAPSSPLTAMLVPEGGDAALSPPDQILGLDPQVLIVPVEPGNVRGLPPTSLQEAMSGRTVLRTDQHGWIRLTTDGQSLWAEVERRPQHPLP